MPRRTWLDSRIDVLVDELAASGIDLDRRSAGELITDRLRAVAAQSGIAEVSARRCFDDESIKELARQMLFDLVDGQPGADLMEVPRTVPLSIHLVGVAVAALAEAMQVMAANEPPEGHGGVVATYGQAISAIGQMTAEAASARTDTAAALMVPPALLRRVARYIDRAAQLAEQGAKLPDGIPETERAELAATLRRDAKRFSTLN